jgi:hypothetical protein
MKGQNERMYYTVQKVCQRKFKKEVYVAGSEIKYEFYSYGPVANIEFSDTGEYIITRMKARFSGKSCKDAKPEDWGEIRDIKVSKNIGQVAREGKEFGLDGCMNATEFYGIYK